MTKRWKANTKGFIMFFEMRKYKDFMQKLNVLTEDEQKLSKINSVHTSLGNQRKSYEIFSHTNL